MKYLVESKIILDGKVLCKDDVIEISKKNAQSLLEQNLISEYTGEDMPSEESDYNNE